MRPERERERETRRVSVGFAFERLTTRIHDAMKSRREMMVNSKNTADDQSSCLAASPRVTMTTATQTITAGTSKTAVVRIASSSAQRRVGLFSLAVFATYLALDSYEIELFCRRE
jgi:hypothetical protein